MSFGLLLSACGLAPLTTEISSPAEAFFFTRDKVPDPEDVFFTVQYPDKSPIQLASHYWRNIDAMKSGVKCPAIVEFSPYRRRDGMLFPDSMMYPFFAYHQYLCFRIDLQGSGDSQGVLTDEYTDEELVYCTQVIQQIASRPDCNGHIGMMGKSWSGFNSLMVAARPDCPKELKAIIVCCGSDDRYNNDVHYLGGAMMFDNISWPSSMLAWLVLPPDPNVVGGRWQEMWRERVQGANFMLKEWGGHQTRDNYWAASAVRGRYDQVKVPVFILSGWQDGYKNPVETVTTGLAAAGQQVVGLVGPWGHKYPFDGYPGPRIDWLRYSLTHWWDKWLKGNIPDANDEWPQMTIWLGESHEPDKSSCGDEKGKWVGEDADWRSRAEQKNYYLGAEHRLFMDLPPGPAEYVSSEQLLLDTDMFETSSWGECGNDDLPGDQANADRESLYFDSEPFAADMDCYGYPLTILNLSCDTPLACVAIRLSEIHPTTRTSHLVSYTFSNLCYRAGDMENPQPVPTGIPFQVKIPLNLIGHTFKKGWQVRLSVSSSFFPTLWQSPQIPILTLYTGSLDNLSESTLILPARPPRPEDGRIQSLLPVVSETTYVKPQDYLPILQEGRPAHTERTAKPITVNGKNGMLVHKIFDSGRYLYGGPLENLWVDLVGEENFQMLSSDPLSLVGWTKYSSIYERPGSGWKVKAETTSRVWTEEQAPGEYVFKYAASVHTFISDEQGKDQPFEQKNMEGWIPRQWV